MAQAVAAKLKMLSGEPASGIMGEVDAYVVGMNIAVIKRSLCVLGMGSMLMRGRLSCAGARYRRGARRMALRRHVGMLSHEIRGCASSLDRTLCVLYPAGGNMYVAYVLGTALGAMRLAS